MIISASRRTDIPAFYSEWFMRRVRAGCCEVVNPFRPSQVTRVSLAPADVDCVVFWTRHAAPLLPHLAELGDRGLRCVFLYTLLDYPAVFETHQPPLAERIETLLRCADAAGPRRVVWRYDPIVLSDLTPPAFHEEAFARLAAALRGRVSRVIVSFLDVYAKTARRIAALAQDGVAVAGEREVRAGMPRLVPALVRIAAAHGMGMQSCAETRGLDSFGVGAGKCIDDRLIADLFGVTVPAAKDPGQRPACRCVASRDIGAYDTCLFGCRYCYATSGRERALANARRHDPEGPALLPPG